VCETERLALKVLQRDKEVLRRLAQAEGEAMAVVVRRLIRKEARERGLLPTQAQAQELDKT
jgi:hypothetical protein